MIKKQIKINNIDDLFELVKMTEKMPFDVDMISGKTAIDLKSIIGVANVDISKKYLLEILCDENEDKKELNQYLDYLKKFKMEE
jgi:PTS HPr component phosphorylation site